MAKNVLDKKAIAINIATAASILSFLEAKKGK